MQEGIKSVSHVAHEPLRFSIIMRCHLSHNSKKSLISKSKKWIDDTVHVAAQRKLSRNLPLSMLSCRSKLLLPQLSDTVSIDLSYAAEGGSLNVMYSPADRSTLLFMQHLRSLSQTWQHSKRSLLVT